MTECENENICIFYSSAPVTELSPLFTSRVLYTLHGTLHCWDHPTRPYVPVRPRFTPKAKKGWRFACLKYHRKSAPQLVIRAIQIANDVIKRKGWSSRAQGYRITLPQCSQVDHHLHPSLLNSISRKTLRCSIAHSILLLLVGFLFSQLHSI